MTTKMQKSTFSYTPYGYSPPPTTPLILFNGEALSRALYVYLLGVGLRAYSPIWMRFYSADRLSPFGRGGINSYSYCSGDPINFQDPSGQMRQSLMRPMRRELVTLDKIYEHQIVSRRPVQRKIYNTNDSPLKPLFDQYHIGKRITKHLNTQERRIIGKIFPEFSAHNTLKLAESRKNPAVTSPPLDTDDVFIRINSAWGTITKQDATDMLKRKATATRAGYVYAHQQISISISRIRSRLSNNENSLDTAFLWQ
ncbi:RHS repeat-associated core domain-containing protein [Pseudomonas asiatica]|uniref:RHS repeat-associated core domain-containing protein n=1 Tax=Pseudomonas asiatica TaxID=2219225 RepID=UPI0015F9038E|nr:RHS repeat-associated core domain-containing protein [Pseudomonas asiatica]MBA6110323.1 RHS repeat-associated core domain-containing protein [Pseudomonas asiatica]